MPTYARRQIVVEDMVGVYHCMAQCVRRAFLCGVDPYTRKDYSHRKEWIVDRMRELAGLFAIGGSETGAWTVLRVALCRCADFAGCIGSGFAMLKRPSFRADGVLQAKRLYD
jgi:hypothetical protein